MSIWRLVHEISKKSCVCNPRKTTNLLMRHPAPVLPLIQAIILPLMPVWQQIKSLLPTFESALESAIALEYINSQLDTCLNIATESIARTDANTPTLLTIQQSKWMALSPPLKRITIAPWLASLVQEISSSEDIVKWTLCWPYQFPQNFQLFVHNSTNIAQN